jgi:hypothetical protein
VQSTAFKATKEESRIIFTPCFIAKLSLYTIAITIPFTKSCAKSSALSDCIKPFKSSATEAQCQKAFNKPTSCSITKYIVPFTKLTAVSTKSCAVKSITEISQQNHLPPSSIKHPSTITNNESFAITLAKPTASESTTKPPSAVGDPSDTARVSPNLARGARRTRDKKTSWKRKFSLEKVMCN